VEATLRDSRKIVAISSTEGNEENSRELSVNNATKRMSTPIVILNARSKSRTTSGRGTTIIRSIDITPAARTTSDFLTKLFRGMLAAATGHPLPRRSLKKNCVSKQNRSDAPVANNAPKAHFKNNYSYPDRIRIQ